LGEKLDHHPFSMEISTSHGCQFWGKILDRKRNKTVKSKEMSSLHSVLDRDVYAYLGVSGKEDVRIIPHHKYFLSPLPIVWLHRRL
jgi:hypothetical protein